MSVEAKREIELEIAHVLFLDIVGYSKLSINEQHARIQELNEIVRESEQFRKAEAASRILKIPTGDGMALVFYKSPEEPAQCAFEINRALKSNPRLQIRMGIHSGPVSAVADVTERTNVAGAGINMAQRVMDCGDAGHILVSKHVAEDLEQHDHWRPLLHDLGSCEVKHGVRLDISNLYSNEVGNPQLPTKFQALKKHRSHVRWAEAAIAVLVVAAVISAFIYILRRGPAHSLANVAEKSIAVLPLVNSTGDPANEYFSDGMSEEFISSLSRLQDLKVIGRTSSFQFKGKTDDSKTIGEKLGVYYLLEGSVRKSADRVRIAVALIKSGDGANVWSETYDRELKDIFAMQSEIANAVAKQLKIALLGNNGQTAQLATAATPSNQNVEAYNALLQGNFYHNRYTAEDTRKAIGYYEEAIRLDPRYALAYAKLSSAAVALAINFMGITTKEGQEALAKARASAKSALDLDPDLAEAHLVQGAVLREFDFNFAAAEAESRRALELAPQNPVVKSNLAIQISDLGGLDEAVALGQQATALEPLRAASHFNLAICLTALGR